MTVSAGALGPACNPAGKAARPSLCGRTNTVGLRRLLGLRGKHRSQPCVQEGTVPAALAVGALRVAASWGCQSSHHPHHTVQEAPAEPAHGPGLQAGSHFWQH